MKQFKFLILIIPLFFALPFIADRFSQGYFAIGLTLIHSLYFGNIAIRTKSNLFSPVSMFVVIYNMYFVLGLIMWIIREKYFDNWDGNYNFVLNVYVITSYMISFWGCSELMNRPRQDPPLRLNQLSLAPIMLGILFFLEYVGIYLFTSGFRVLPFLEEDINAARIELGSEQGAGAGIGAILIYCGILCIYHILSSQWNVIFKVILFVLAYIPFLLYGGRLLMVLPLLVTIMTIMVKKKLLINKKMLLKLSIGVILSFAGLMYFGTMRASRDIDMDIFLYYTTGDLFPEFRGSVAAYSLNKLDLGLSYITMIFANMFPGSIASVLGIDKAHQIVIGGYVADLLGYEDIGIRTSITGELLLTSILSYIVFWFAILLFLHQINKQYFKNHYWGKDKCIYMYIGLFTSLIIPYGVSLIPNLIITTFVLLFLKSVMYRRADVVSGNQLILKSNNEN